ncbi:EamA family transporter [Lentzea sp. CA-135723]|uniref:EamA family transporter n=1 Tax=Lentzea sp. CA-135723 TaxID=3239950 RepID=UPI003D8CC6F3
MSSATGLATPPTSALSEPRSTWSVDRLDARVALILGAATFGLTGPLIALSSTTASTSAFYRALLAVPLLIVMRAMRRRHGERPVQRTASQRCTALLAGAFLGVDMVLWTKSILAVGAGVATVLVHVQVVAVPLACLMLYGERV